MKMETLQLILFEYILGYGLQAFIIIFGIYTFNRQKIEIKKYILASILLTIIIYIIRQLPITFGVHTIINTLSIFVLCILILKMSAYNTIRSLALVTIILLISEIIQLVVMSMILGKETIEKAMLVPDQKAMLGLIANVIYLLLIALSYYIIKKKGDSNRKISS